MAPKQAVPLSGLGQTPLSINEGYNIFNFIFNQCRDSLIVDHWELELFSSLWGETWEAEVLILVLNDLTSVEGRRVMLTY